MMTAPLSRSLSEPHIAAMRAGYTHSAYGLQVYSELRLPELPGGGIGAPDITVRLGSIDLPRPVPAEDEDGAAAVLSNGAYLYYYQGVGTFLIEAGRTITIDPDAEADEPLLRLYLLGPAFGLLLHQRGELALHASAVCINGQVVAFVGESGEGKSTLAAFLHRSGYDVLTDDVLVIRPDRNGVLMAHPGFAQIKLWPESVEAFGDDLDRLPQIHASLEKRFYRPAYGFADAPLPLSRVYVLGEDDAIRTVPMQLHEALLELVVHTYALRFIGSAGTTAAHFRQCAAIATATTVEYLVRPRSLDTLPALAALVKASLSFPSDVGLLEIAV